MSLVDRALADGQAVMPGPVLSELLSDPKIDSRVVDSIGQVPLLEPTSGFWERAGRLRASVLAGKRRAQLTDAMIAQLCLDHRVHLITRDRDFRVFAESAGLGLAV